MKFLMIKLIKSKSQGSCFFANIKTQIIWNDGLKAKDVNITTYMVEFILGNAENEKVSNC